MVALAGQNIIRIAAVALGLSTLSFAAGVAGDLSIIDPPRSGQRVVVRIPPEIPADAPRAAPMLSTAAAEAAPVRFLLERERRQQRLMIVEEVQAAHEIAFESTPIAFETAALPELKPQRLSGVKPVVEAPVSADETKAA
ncbi:MAG: hypothetical protein R3C30_08160 [Hyphomonadaceae bacterium]